MTMARLVSVEIEAFRGFRHSESISLDADFVLVTGANGTGKTCLTDALTWGLTGKLSHLTDRLRQLPKTEDHIVNRYAAAEGKDARVTLCIRVRGSDYSLTRRGSRRGSTLEVVDATGNLLSKEDQFVAELFGASDPARLLNALTSWGILRQDAMQMVVTAAPERLTPLLAGILGLDQLSKFVASSRQYTRRLNAEVRDMTAQLGQQRDELRRRIEQQERAAMAESPEGEPALVRLADAVRSDHSRWLGKITASEMLDANVVALAGREVGEAIEVLERVLASIAEAAQEEGRAARVLAEAQRSYRPDESAEAKAVRLALAVLQDDTCPVCAHDHPAGTLRGLLENRLRALSSADFKLSPEIGAAQRAHQEGALRMRESAKQRLLDFATRTSIIGLGAEVRSELDRASVESALRELSDLRERLRELYRCLRPAGSSADYRAIVAGVAAQREVVGQVEQQLTEGRRNASQAKAFEDAALEVASEILQAALDDVAFVFSDVYERLSPHPTFRSLELRSLGSFGSARVIPYVSDHEHNVDGNPTLVCSDGQLSVIALSLFLGTALTTDDTPLPFVIMDDPMQAMDVLNVLGFGDLCRQLRDQRQVIVATHDRRFAAILERKLTPRDSGHTTRRVDFLGCPVK